LHILQFGRGEALLAECIFTIPQEIISLVGSFVRRLYRPSKSGKLEDEEDAESKVA
jgi:hypothetical protein